MKRTAFSLHNELYVQYLKSENKHNMSVQHYHDTYEIYLQLSGKVTTTDTFRLCALGAIDVEDIEEDKKAVYEEIH